MRNESPRILNAPDVAPLRNNCELQNPLVSLCCNFIAYERKNKIHYAILLSSTLVYFSYLVNLIKHQKLNLEFRGRWRSART